MKSYKTSVAVYTRVSTDKESQVNSFDNQRKYFTDYINKNPEYELYKIYGDRGVTGTKLKRPEFDKMLYDAGLDVRKVTAKGRNKYVYISSDREPKFKWIYIKNTSRFSRNVLSADVLRELRMKGVYVHFMDINKSTKDLSDNFIIQLFQIFDEQESRDKSEKVRFGMEQSAKDGIILTGGNLYGYKLIKGVTPKQNKLEIIEEEAEVVRKIYNLYANGIGERNIEKILKEEKIYTKYNKPFCRSSIRRILINEKYIGVLVRNKYETGVVLVNKHAPKLRPKEEWIYHEDADIPPIINRELFEKCQSIRQGKHLHKVMRGKNLGRGEYSGLIICKKCGKNYARNINRGKVFFNCDTKKRFGISQCDNKNITEEILNQKIDDFIKSNQTTPNTHRFYISTLNSYITYLNSLIDVDTEKYINDKEVSISTLSNKLERVKELYFDGDLSKDEYLSRKQSIDVEIKKLKDEMLNIDSTNLKYKLEIDKVKATIKEIEEIDVKDKPILSREDFFDNISFISIDEDDVTFEFFISQEQYNYILKALETVRSYLHDK